MATTVEMEKSALRGRPSLVWRGGQQRRLEMILKAAEGRQHGWVLDNGCGVGAYLEHLTPLAERAFGLERDLEHAADARSVCSEVISARSERLPFPDGIFDLIVSHEVLEHVRDDRFALQEMVRTLRPPGEARPAGRLVLFVPNRGYPVETHGIYWRGKYRFGNIPLVNYLPTPIRNKLAPHVRAYSAGQLRRLTADLPVSPIQRTVIYGAYDNLIARWPRFGRLLRGALQALEGTPLRTFGLSHFWVLERQPGELPN